QWREKSQDISTVRPMSVAPAKKSVDGALICGTVLGRLGPQGASGETHVLDSFDAPWRRNREWQVVTYRRQPTARQSVASHRRAVLRGVEWARHQFNVMAIVVVGAMLVGATPAYAAPLDSAELATGV